jgi:hypothetical protein
MHASILSQMDLLANRYDELSTELSKCVHAFFGTCVYVNKLRVHSLRTCLVCSNDGSFSAEKITKLSIEMADLEPKVLAVKELRAKQAAVKELDEVRIHMCAYLCI